MKRQFFNTSALVLLFSLTIFSSCQSDQESVVPATSSKSNLANRSGLVPKGRLIINNQTPFKFVFDVTTYGYDLHTGIANRHLKISTPLVVPPDSSLGGFTIFDSYVLLYNYYYLTPLEWRYENEETNTTLQISDQYAYDTFAEPYDLNDPTGAKFVHWQFLRSRKARQQIGVFDDSNYTQAVNADVTILLPEFAENTTTSSEIVIDLSNFYGDWETFGHQLHITTFTSLIDNGDGTVDTFVKIKSFRSFS